MSQGFARCEDRRKHNWAAASLAAKRQMTQRESEQMILLRIGEPNLEVTQWRFLRGYSHTQCSGDRIAALLLALRVQSFPGTWCCFSLRFADASPFPTPKSLPASASGDSPSGGNCRPESRGGRRRVGRDKKVVGFVCTAGANRSNE